MSAPFDTLFLDVESWDLTVDASRNIALAKPPYAVTQDVASACRVFLGEVYYDTSQGVPYLPTILGRTPPLNVMQAAIAAAALTVPSVVGAACVISAFQDRTVIGQIQFETADGNSFQVAL